MVVLAVMPPVKGFLAFAALPVFLAEALCFFAGRVAPVDVAVAVVPCWLSLDDEDEEEEAAAVGVPCWLEDEDEEESEEEEEGEEEATRSSATTDLATGVAVRSSTS